MQKTCLKCGHVNPSATGAAAEACPQCGAIYRKVEAAHEAGQSVRRARPVVLEPEPAPAGHAAASHVATANAGGANDAAFFLQDLRAGSSYPTFRVVVRIFAWFGYFMALCAALAGLAGMILGHSFMQLIIGAIGAALIIVITRVFKEVSLMVADGCDALIHMAARHAR